MFINNSFVLVHAIQSLEKVLTDNSRYCFEYKGKNELLDRIFAREIRITN